jgi:hypothetical protein
LDSTTTATVWAARVRLVAVAAVAAAAVAVARASVDEDDHRDAASLRPFADGALLNIGRDEPLRLLLTRT